MAEGQQTGERAEYGSNEYEFVEKLDSKFICTVCCNVLHQPMLTGCCGQHCCQMCLDLHNSSSYGQRCPYCRASNYTKVLDRPLQCDIKSLKIFCTNRSLGCMWADKLEKLSHHLESEKGCDFASIECVLCGETLNRGQITKHLHNECSKRLYECEYCGKRDTYIAITGQKKVTGQKRKIPEEKGHYAECSEYVIRCPNMCGKKMKRKEIKGHQINCPCKEVECTFRGPNETGETMTCGRKMRQSELSNHKNNYLFRMFECRFCSKASTYVAITGERRVGTLTKQSRILPEKGHYAECPSYPLACKNKCQSGDIKRADMEQHLTVCPLEPVLCPLRDMGCQEMVYRKDLNEHLTRNQQQHLNFVCGAYTQTKTELAATRVELAATRVELAATKEELSATKAGIETLHNSTGTRLATVTNELDSTKRELTLRVDTFTTSLAEVKTTLADVCQTSMEELDEVKTHLETMKAPEKTPSATTAGGRKTLHIEETHSPRRRRRRFWKRK